VLATAPSPRLILRARSDQPCDGDHGILEDANFVAHRFLRGGDGTFTTFDAQGAINGTIPSSINPEGAITGYYYDTNVVAHGFLRAKDGT
jgi:hypothetical protein